MRIFANARIAVLDADAARRAYICKALSDFGMLKLLPVGSADEARALIEGAQLDLCVVDATGFAGAGAVLAQNPFDPERTPAILIVAEPTRAIVKDALASGYRLVMPAPVVPRILYRRIGSILQKVRRAGRAQAPERTPSPLMAAAEVHPD
jgi:DNA-binding response OmpR family regulator